MGLPLILEKHFFRKMEVVAPLEKIQTDPVGQVEYSVDTQVRSGRHKGDESRWMVELTVRVRPQKPGEPAYDIDLVEVGLFQTQGPLDPDPEQVEKLVIINGASILYSSAREFLLILTARGPFPSVYLPTVNFQGLEKAEDKCAEPGKEFEPTTK